MLAEVQAKAIDPSASARRLERPCQRVMRPALSAPPSGEGGSEWPAPPSIATEGGSRFGGGLLAAKAAVAEAESLARGAMAQAQAAEVAFMHLPKAGLR